MGVLRMNNYPRMTMTLPSEKRSLAVDRRTNSMVNRRAYEIAHQLIPGIKAYLLDRIRFEQEQAREAGETGIYREEFIMDALADSSAQEALYDIRSNI